MKSVYYGKSAQDLSLDTYRFWGFEMGRAWGRERAGGLSLYKNVKISGFSAQIIQKHINSSVESVDKTLLTYRAQKEESQYYSFNLEEKCSLQVVLCFSLFFLKESATCFCGRVSTAWINWQGKQYLFIKKSLKKKPMCSVLAWETKHFFPVEIS